MRKYLFILILLVAAFSAKAQQSYTVDLTGLTYSLDDGVKNSTSSHLTIELIYDDNTKYVIYNRGLGEKGDREDGWSTSVLLGKLPKRVHTEGFVNFRSGTDASYDQYNDLNICSVNNLDVDDHSPRMTGIWFDIKITPHVSIVNPIPTLLPDEDKVTLHATPGYPASVYNWEFDLDGWTAFPGSLNSSGQSDVTFSLKDLLQGDPLSKITLNTRFWIKTCASPQVTSNIVTINNRLSSPKITGLDVQPNKCFGESNGYVKIKFSRAIVQNELLNIFVEDTTNPNGYNSSRINIAALDADSSYTWPAELPPGGYRITLLGKYPNSATTTYTDGPQHVGRFGFTGPTAVTYSTGKRDVYCFGGSDATITVNASGGVGNYAVGYKKVQDGAYTWLPFSAANTHTIAGLDSGTYNIRIKDGNDCMMRDGSGTEVIGNVTISQPAAPLHVDNADPINPLAFGYTDGSVKVILIGGTPIGGSTYNLLWTTEDGTRLTPEPATTNPFTTQVKNLGDGKYLIVATDANYGLTSGTSANGCIVRDTFKLTQPPPLVVTVEQYRYVSCKNAADGQLIAKANGGIEIPRSRYKYQWLKNDNGTWKDIQQPDSIAEGLKAGDYKMIITDYNNITKESLPFTLVEPDLLTLTLSSSPLNCNGSNNGAASAVVAGGTLPYELEWNTGETTDSISNLAMGNYKAFVKDARGCQTETQVKVTSPNPVEISNIVVKPPTCYKGTDGAISYTAAGGTLPYNYQWSNGALSPALNGLTAGSYKLRLVDSKGCPLEETFTVPETPLVTIGLPQNMTLCVGQVYEANGSIPNGSTYQWTGPNSFSAADAKANLSDEGTYYVTATNINGCVGKDTISITRTNATVAAELLASTQAFTNEAVTVVNISKPAPEKVEWVLPSKNVTVLSTSDEYIQLQFADTGRYIIGLKAMVGACEKTVVQPITIVQPEDFDQPGGTYSPFITAFTVAPNPSNGQFTVKISLEEAAVVKLRLINLNTGNVVDLQQQSGSKQYQIPYNVQFTTGIYSLVLETAKEFRVIKVIIL